ncbi:MAG: hypothetical protein AAFP76_12260 [Bacteroidota bacterium]
MKKTIKIGWFGVAMLLLMTNCVQRQHLKTITFKVDMNGMDSISEVGIRGEFTSTPWSETLPLTDRDGDGIYEGTFSKETAHNGFEFKFVLNGAFELEGKDNRLIVMEYKPETLIYEAVFNNPDGILSEE